jgi:hypothetical protein
VIVKSIVADAIGMPTSSSRSRMRSVKSFTAVRDVRTGTTKRADSSM